MNYAFRPLSPEGIFDIFGGEPCVFQLICVYPKIGGKPPKGMVKIMANSIKMDDLGVPLFLETPICVYPRLPFVLSNLSENFLTCKNSINNSRKGAIRGTIFVYDIYTHTIIHTKSILN